MIVWKYVFIYTAVVVVMGFVLTMLWHHWRYRVRGKRRAVVCAAQLETAALFHSDADRQARKSDEWFRTQTTALASVRKELRSIKA
jgi:hypothetical protein